jgi:acetyl/propionyl-CoA carboxylase alpha subunit
MTMKTRIAAPMSATVVELAVAPGQAVRRGELLLIVEAASDHRDAREQHRHGRAGDGRRARAALSRTRRAPV